MAAKTKAERAHQLRELQLRILRQRQSTLRRGNDYVPTKKSVKYSGKASPTTAEQNLQGVPGNARNKYTSMVQEIAAAHTGTVTRKAPIGILRSARNANTTTGSYITTIVQEGQGRIVSDSQGRKELGR